MGFSCPRCGSSELNEEIENDPRVLCTGCNACWKPEQEQRLVDVPERRRRDTDD